jgi:hypothetical protein
MMESDSSRDSDDIDVMRSKAALIHKPANIVQPEGIYTSYHHHDPSKKPITAAQSIKHLKVIEKRDKKARKKEKKKKDKEDRREYKRNLRRKEREYFNSLKRPSKRHGE